MAVVCEPVGPGPPTNYGVNTEYGVSVGALGTLGGRYFRSRLVLANLETERALCL